MSISSSSDFDAFLAQAWADHADHSLAVAERLRNPVPPPGTPAQIAALTRLLVHLLGEHLGQFDDARSRLAALAVHPLADEDVQSTLRSSRVALDLAEPRPAPTAGLSEAEIVRAESAAAAICVGRGHSERAMALIDAARQRVAALPEATPADHRPLAVACNNMTWALHERGSARTAADTAAMLELAAASREHWSRAGTWLEVERADYGLALTHLAAGVHDALRHAERCLAACIEHGAPPYEHFYGHEAMARVQQARGNGKAAAHHANAAQAAFDRLADEDDRTACRPTLETLRALAA